MPLELDTGNGNFAKIKVVGVGGGGSNAVNRMCSYGLEGAEFIIVNTDKQALYLSSVPQKIQIGEKLTKGLGSGGDPETGRKAAEESREELEQNLKGADMVFIAAGLGGGTGTGAAPVIADIAKSCDALTVAFVTMPFAFEGKPRNSAAEDGYRQLAERVDSIVRVPNDKLLTIMGKNTTLLESFRLADDALRQGIQGLTEIIAKPAMINLDFADVKSVMKEHGTAHMGIGIAYGEDKVIEATKQAIMSPLLDTNMQGAKGVIINFIVDKTCGLPEIDEAMKLVREAADDNANLFMGADIDMNLQDEVRVTVIATGFGMGKAAHLTSEKKPSSQSGSFKAKVDALGNSGEPTLFSSSSQIGSFDYSGEDELEIPRFEKKSPRRIRTGE